MAFNIQKMLRQSRMEDKARVNGMPITSAKELHDVEAKERPCLSLGESAKTVEMANTP